MKLENSTMKVIKKLSGSKKIITVSSEKGGIGKSTTVMNKSKMISSQGIKVLVVDGDPQGDLTALFNNLKHIDAASAKANDFITTAALFDSDLQGNSVLNVDDNLSVIIGTAALYEVDQRPRDNFILNVKKHLHKIMDQHGFDVCIIDTPPTAGNRMLGFQLSCDLLVMPIELSVLAIRAISKNVIRLRGLKTKLKESMPELIIMPNKVDRRTTEYHETMPQVKLLKYNVTSEIAQNAAISSSTNKAVSVWDLPRNKSSRTGGQMLERAYKEILKLII